MADFVNKKTVVTKKPKIVVEPGLKPGKYRFEMVAVTTDGRELSPQRVSVEIVERLGDDLDPELGRNNWPNIDGDDLLRDLRRWASALHRALIWVKKNTLLPGRC